MGTIFFTPLNCFQIELRKGNVDSFQLLPGHHNSEIIVPYSYKQLGSLLDPCVLRMCVRSNNCCLLSVFFFV